LFLFLFFLEENEEKFHQVYEEALTQTIVPKGR